MYIKQEKQEFVNINEEPLFDSADKLFTSLSLDATSHFREFITDIAPGIPSLLFFLEDTDDLYKKFLSAKRIQEEIRSLTHADFIARDLFDWIPKSLAAEVDGLIERNYKGDKAAYVRDCAMYFATFTMEDLFISNLTERGHFNQELVSTHLKLRKRKLWHAQVLLKLVGGHKQLGLPSYVCSSLLREHKQRIKRAQDYINNNYIVNENGENFCLSEVVRTTKHRVAENLNVVKAFERMARPDPKGPKLFEWAFITLTLPPEWHPNPSVGRNSYNGLSPYESAKGMKRKWNLVRALLRKRGIEPAADYYGVLVSEAHKDGCQHLHALLFYRAGDLDEIKHCFASVFPNLNFNQEDKNCTFKLDNGKAKASSYVFKYINKSTTLFDCDLDIYGEHDEATRNAIANSAFRSYNHIRGVSYFGLENCLTKWRFVCRNKSRLDLQGRLKTVVEGNDFYSFLEELHFSYIVNRYSSKMVRRTNIYGDTTERVSKKFIGCEISGFLFLKNFFSKCTGNLVAGKFRNALASKAKDNRAIVAAEEGATGLTKTSPKLGAVLVNHNYSSEGQNTGTQIRNTEITKAEEQLMREFSLFGVNFSPDYQHLRPVESF